jgi:hypothetical protein
MKARDTARASELPQPLVTAIHELTDDPDKRAKLIAAWALTLQENEQRAERIRADVASRPDGYFRHADDEDGDRR